MVNIMLDSLVFKKKSLSKINCIERYYTDTKDLSKVFLLNTNKKLDKFYTSYHTKSYTCLFTRKKSAHYREFEHLFFTFSSKTLFRK